MTQYTIPAEGLVAKPAHELAAMIQSGEVTSREVTQAFLDRIAEVDGELGAFLHVGADEALAAADKVDEQVKNGEQPASALAGVPLALKDLLVTTDAPTTAASKMLEGYMSPYDATAVAKLRAAGIPILGKTNLDEFAMGSSNENSAFGPAHNPYDTERTPGGSGGGTAAALASGQAPLGIGTDTGGSIRQPAALCGITGLKPTYGRVSRYGMIAFASSLDQAGPMARTAEEIVREERRLATLERRVDTSTDSLGRTFERIIGLLTEMDYVELDAGEPQVTDEGERLSRIHNVSDLLVAQCLKRGIWDGLDPAELAGVASMVVFENRRATGGNPEAATDAMADAMGETMRVYGELVSDEQRHGLPATRLPDSGFCLSIHQWTAGAPLGYALAAAAESGAELTPGDFVRWCRQVIDLLEQIKKTGYSDEIRDNANRAVDAIRRGVVAIGN